MLKLVRRIFFGRTVEEIAAKDMADIDEKYGRIPIDWVNGGVPLDHEVHRMVSEPVITLLTSLKARPNRFKIYKISHDQYIESRKDHADTYRWMRNGCLFYKFVDSVTAIKHTVVVSEGKIYRVDDLPFTLNYWELTVLMKGFTVARQPSVDRIIKRRQRRIEIERELKEEIEKHMRAAYQEAFR